MWSSVSALNSQPINSMTPQKLGLFIVLACLSAVVGFYLAISKADAATSLQPTARDWQRLNACSAAITTYGEKPEKEQEARTITCAAYGKAVSHIESAKGSSVYAIQRRNLYGIRYWDKKGKPHIKTYKTYYDAHLDYSRIYFLYYEGLSNKRKAAKYTGEPFIVATYTAHLNKWVPIYTTLYNSMVSE